MRERKQCPVQPILAVQSPLGQIFGLDFGTGVDVIGGARSACCAKKELAQIRVVEGDGGGSDGGTRKTGHDLEG